MTIQNAKEIVGFIYNGREYLITGIRPLEIIVCTKDGPTTRLFVIREGSSSLSNRILFKNTGTYTFLVN